MKKKRGLKDLKKTLTIPIVNQAGKNWELGLQNMQESYRSNGWWKKISTRPIVNWFEKN